MTISRESPNTTAIREWVRSAHWPPGSDVNETLLSLCDALDQANACAQQIITTPGFGQVGWWAAVRTGHVQVAPRRSDAE